MRWIIQEWDGSTSVVTRVLIDDDSVAIVYDDGLEHVVSWHYFESIVVGIEDGLHQESRDGVITRKACQPVHGLTDIRYVLGSILKHGDKIWEGEPSKFHRVSPSIRYEPDAIYMVKERSW